MIRVELDWDVRSDDWSVLPRHGKNSAAHFDFHCWPKFSRFPVTLRWRALLEQQTLDDDVDADKNEKQVGKSDVRHYNLWDWTSSVDSLPVH
jgi:hypothetical protein